MFDASKYICGFLMAVLYLDPFTAMCCCRAVVSEDAKTTLASGLQTLSLERESNTVSRCVRPYHLKQVRLVNFTKKKGLTISRVRQNLTNQIQL